MDQDGNAPSSDSQLGPCLPVRIHAQTIENTSISLNAVVDVLGPFYHQTITNETGMLLLRQREPDPGGTVGYIMADATNHPLFVVQDHAYFDAPDLKILGGSGRTDLHSKPVDMLLRGPVTFTPEGRLQVFLTNAADVNIPVNINVLGIVGIGTVTLTIPAGNVSFNLRGPERL
jgi:hypothetical protein